MKKNWTWIIAALALVLIIGGASVLYNHFGADYQADRLATQAPPVNAETTPSQTEEATQPENMTAPDFTMYDADGNAVKLSDFFGKPIVLNFWASWCGPCQSEMPEFEEVFLEQGQQLQFLMVNMTDGSRETVEIASAFIEDSGYTFPVYYDTAFEAAVNYGVTSLPTTYFISADGTLTAYAMGAINAATLQQGIDMILSDT